MKKTILTILSVTLMTSGIALAQSHPAPDFEPAPAQMGAPDMPPPPAFDDEKGRPSRMMNRRPNPAKFAEELGLTEEQKKASEEMRQKMRAEIAPLKKQIEDLEKQIKDLREKNKEVFEKMLTPEQKEKLEQLHEKMKHRFEESGRKKGRPDGKRPKKK